MNNKTGEMAWLDITVENAESLRDFYQEVIGWKAEPVSMGEYDDFTMMPLEGDQPAAGICHARGGNADLPPQWLPYFLVEDIDKSCQSVIEKGGKLVTQIKTMGADKYAVIQDNAGAACALYQKG